MMRSPALCRWSDPVEGRNPINGNPCDAWSDCARPAETDGLCSRHHDAVGRVVRPFLDAAVEAEREVIAEFLATWPDDRGTIRAGGAPEYNDGMRWACRFAAEDIVASKHRARSVKR